MPNIEITDNETKKKIDLTTKCIELTIDGITYFRKDISEAKGQLMKQAIQELIEKYQIDFELCLPNEAIVIENVIEDLEKIIESHELKTKTKKKDSK